MATLIRRKTPRIIDPRSAPNPASTLAGTRRTSHSMKMRYRPTTNASATAPAAAFTRPPAAERNASVPATPAFSASGANSTTHLGRWVRPYSRKSWTTSRARDVRRGRSASSSTMLP